ncbi:MAG TPA: glycosyltransferase family 39 protein, partial [Candidatus Acidoferrales bacterium]
MISRLLNQQSREAVTRSGLQWRSVVLALLVAALLRSLPLLDNRFHPDEALYAYFARLIASGRDPLLSGVVVDKPPLSIYLNSLSLLVFGGHEFAARLPNFYASLVGVALSFALARRLYDALTAQVATWVCALSPFAILFSIIVFIDPLITAFVLWGLWTAAGPGPIATSRWNGLAFALAFATKQTALVFLPLALGLRLLSLPPTASPRQALRHLAAGARPLL